MATDSRPTVPWGLREMVIASVMAITIVLGGGLLVGGVLPSLTEISVQPLVPILVGALEALLFVPVAWMLYRYRLGWGSVGFRAPIGGWDTAFRHLAMALFLSYAAIIVWGLILLPFDLRPQENVFPQLFGTGESVFVLVLFTGAVVAPIAEEVFFRGFLFAGLRRRYTLPIAYGVSAVSFAVVHFTPAAFPPLVALGIFLAWLYDRTGSIWPPVLLHAFVNSVTLVAWYAEATDMISLSA